MDSRVVWKGGMAFEAEVEGFKLMIDASSQHGGQGLGPKPKTLTLTSLSGCTAMDVISILTKMRVKPDVFDVQSYAVLREEHPKIFTHVKIVYRFEGTDLPIKKLLRAVELSEDRYCGVSAMLKESSEVTSEVWLNGEKLDR